MRRSSALMGVAAVAFMATSAFAQAKTSFAGTWNMVVDSAAMAQQQAMGGGGRGGRGGGRGGFGATFSVSQDDKALTITRTMGQAELKQVYNLDGSDSKNTMPGRGGNPGMEQVSHAKWDGSSIVISTEQQSQNGPVTVTQKLTIDASGALWVETTRPGQDGTPNTSKVQYKKS